MFSYYGSKSKIVDYYPKPKFDKIIEPFAGSARYSLKYFDRDITIVDKYQVIIGVWKYLQSASKKDILKLPRLKWGQTVNDFNLSDIEKKLVGFYCHTGNATPAIKASERNTIYRPNIQNYQIRNIAENLYKIKHWKIIEGSYIDIKNDLATYYIDPPYQFGGEHYKESNKNINFNDLGEWCKSRNGHVIVCENTKANWMNFEPIIDMRGSIHTTTESIWTNYPTSYNNNQTSLF